MFLPLTKKGDFKRVFDRGFRFSSTYLVVYALPNGLCFSRLGLSVGKKIGNAVVRNKIRRRLREALRKELVDNRLRYDFVIVARKASVDADFAGLKKTLLKVLSGLMNEKTADSDNKNI